MARKAKTVAVKEAVAVTQTAPQATTVVSGGIDDALAMVEGAGVKAAPVKDKKASVPVVAVNGKMSNGDSLEKGVLQFALAAAQMTEAEGKKDALGGELRPMFDSVWEKWCRDNKSFSPRLNMSASGTIIGFTGGQLKVASPDKKHPVLNSPKAINDGLKEHFGVKYQDYIEPTLYLFVKPVKELESSGLTLTGVIKTLQEKLGADFAKIFGHSQGVDLKRAKIGSDEVVILRQTAAMDAAVDAQVESAIEKGLLTKTNGALSPSAEAKALAEEKLEKLEAELKAEREAKLAKEAAKSAAPTVQVTIK